MDKFHDDMTQEEVVTLQNEMESLQWDMNDKIDAIMFHVNRYKALADWAKKEKDRLAKLQKSYERQSNNWKDYVQMILKAQWIEKLETPSNTLTISKRKAWELVNPAFLPKDLIKQSMSFSDVEIIKQLLSTDPTLSEYVEFKEMSNTDVMNYIKTLEEWKPLTIEERGGGEAYYQVKEWVLYYLWHEWDEPLAVAKIVENENLLCR